MSKELLDLHLQLLVLQFGRTQVVRSLARIDLVSEDAIEKELDLLSKAKVAKSPKSRPTQEALLARLQLPQEIHDVIGLIAREFENKRFLGERRLVEKFLIAHGVPKAPKNRSDALPKVLSILSKLSIIELKEILSTVLDAKSGSEYSHLAGAIMNLRDVDQNRRQTGPT